MPYCFSSMTEDHERRLTPIYALSPEVVIAIFSNAIYSTTPTVAQHSVPTSGISSNSDDSLTPVTLSHVCSAWRTIALSSPELWSTLYITQASDGLSHLLRIWLSRSGTRQLNITVRDGAGWSDASVPHLLRVFDILGDEASRWRSFRVEKFHGWWPSHLGYKIARALMEKAKPQLEALAIDVRPVGPFDEAGSLSKTLVAISLKKLMMSFMTLQRDFPFAGSRYPRTSSLYDAIPWGQLTSLCLVAVSLSEVSLGKGNFFDMLSECKNVETLSVSLNDHDDGRTRTDWPVMNLPKLRTLNAVGMTFLSVLFDTLDLPNLADLSIHTDTTNSKTRNLDFYSSLSDFLSRSACHLQSLSFRDCNESEGDSMNALLTHRSASQISRLRIGNRVDVTTSTNLASDTNAVPNLAYLVLDSVKSYSSTESPLVALALSRFAIIAKASVTNSREEWRSRSLLVNFESGVNYAAEMSAWGSAVTSKGQELSRVNKRYRYTGLRFGSRPFGNQLRCGDFSMILE